MIVSSVRRLETIGREKGYRKAEGRRQKAEGRRQKAEGRRQKAGTHSPASLTKVEMGSSREEGRNSRHTEGSGVAREEGARKTAGPRRAPRVRLPKFVGAYFFFDAFLLLFLEDFAAAFLVAISLTTFHAVRDLPVAPTWQTTAGLLRPT